MGFCRYDCGGISVQPRTAGCLCARVNSPRKAAQESGKFEREIAPVTVTTRKGEVVVDQDEGPQTHKLKKCPLYDRLFKRRHGDGGKRQFHQ